MRPGGQICRPIRRFNQYAEAEPLLARDGQSSPHHPMPLSRNSRRPSVCIVRSKPSRRAIAPSDSNLMTGQRMAEKQRPNDKRISLVPLDFEQAMKGLLAAGPHPKDDEPEPAEGPEKAPL